MRDMVQNHLLQLCALVAIEPPAEWNPRAVRDEKVKVLRAVRKINPDEVERDAVRGQYGAGSISGERVPAYREEEKVAADSPVETYAALKLHIDNVRWAGVPFYLRSGKRLAKRATEIVVEFKPAPHTPGCPGASWFRRPEQTGRQHVSARRCVCPGGREAAGTGDAASIDQPPLLPYDDQRRVESPSAYEHLLLDALLSGDPTFFARADEVEAAWEIVEPVIDLWEAERPPTFPTTRLARPARWG